MLIRPARPDEAAALVSDLAMRSKAYWGYDDDFMAGCRAELTIEPREVVPRRVTVMKVQESVVGFYAMEGVPPTDELSFLFIAPERIRTGAGRSLFEHAVATARTIGLKNFTIDADPFAEDFYVAMGAIRTGATPSRVLAGRELPRLTFRVASG